MDIVKHKRETVMSQVKTMEVDEVHSTNWEEEQYG